ncbi:MAG: S1 RNA-binding domain-containing protein [Clostridia bacterium]|nr:S1 RNA-binding domain-containing protein [Clostridia bacterium]
MDEKNDIKIAHGKVTEIISFGAMVKLDDGSRGLIHISEVSDDYVYNVADYLAVGMEVTVAILSERDANKKRLSVRQAGVVLPRLQRTDSDKSKNDKALKAKKREEEKEAIRKRNEEAERRLILGPPDEPLKERKNDGTFEERLKKYMKDSEARLVDVKHQTENKRGGSGNKKG